MCLQKIKNIIKWELWKFYSIENLYNTLLKIGFIGELATIHIKREEVEEYGEIKEDLDKFNQFNANFDWKLINCKLDSH